MELKEFVGSILTDIAEGVISAQTSLLKKGALVVPRYVETGAPVMLTKDGAERAYVDLVEFRVAIGEVSKSGGGVGVGVLLGAVGVKGGAEKGIENKTLTEVKFSIPIRYPAYKTE